MSMIAAIDLPALYLGCMFLSALLAQYFLKSYLADAFTGLVRLTIVMSMALVCLLFYRDEAPLLVQLVCVALVYTWIRLIVPFLASHEAVYTDYTRIMLEGFGVIVVLVFLVFGLHFDNLQFLFRTIVVLALLFMGVQFAKEQNLPPGLNRYAFTGLSIVSAFALFWWTLGSQPLTSESPLDSFAGEFWIAMILIWIVFFMAIIRLYFSINSREKDRIEKLAQAQENRLVLSTQVESLDRQRALGMLASSLQHELRQPLAAMTVNTQLIARALKRNEATGGYVDQCLLEVKQELQRFKRQIKAIRGFIGSSELEAFSSVMIEVAIDDVLRFLMPELSKLNIQIRVDVEPGCELRVAANQLNHALLHCMMNAMESIQNSASHQTGGRINVIVKRDDAHCLIRIEDTGSGMTDEQMQKAGKEIFTTKSGRLGLGLLMVNQFLVNCSGHMVFDTEGPNFAIVLALPYQ
jgi:signal transduction histidine kinase